MRIIDCFTFYNELDILEYRLSLLYPNVDYFVLSEATKTHRGNPKPLFFRENKERFSRFLDKIVYVLDEDLVENPIVSPNQKRDDGVWKNENHQRNALNRGIEQIVLYSNDLIMISDVDEIPDIQTILENREAIVQNRYIGLIQDFYYYHLTCKNPEKWSEAKVMTYSYYCHILNKTPQICRMHDHHLQVNGYLYRGGWHLSYFGNAETIRNKIMQFGHQEFNHPEYTQTESILKKIKNNEDLYSRPYEKWITVPLQQNDYLPPNYEKFMNVFFPAGF
jgi:beta-1,4-mannosyl-glycoprotein beta-1,4-N-acetylglucosaminyltransferase